MTDMTPDPKEALREKVSGVLMGEVHAPMTHHDPHDGSCVSCPWPVHELGPEEITDALIKSGVFGDVYQRGWNDRAKYLGARDFWPGRNPYPTSERGE